MIATSIGFIFGNNTKDYNIMATMWNCKYKEAVCDDDVYLALKHIPWK
jgi:hypothetical protein